MIPRMERQVPRRRTMGRHGSKGSPWVENGRSKAMAAADADSDVGGAVKNNRGEGESAWGIHGNPLHRGGCSKIELRTFKTCPNNS